MAPRQCFLGHSTGLASTLGGASTITRSSSADHSPVLARPLDSDRIIRDQVLAHHSTVLLRSLVGARSETRQGSHHHWEVRAPSLARPVPTTRQCYSDHPPVLSRSVVQACITGVHQGRGRRDSARRACSTRSRQRWRSRRAISSLTPSSSTRRATGHSATTTQQRSFLADGDTLRPIRCSPRYANQWLPFPARCLFLCVARESRSRPGCLCAAEPRPAVMTRPIHARPLPPSSATHWRTRSQPRTDRAAPWRP